MMYTATMFLLTVMLYLLFMLIDFSVKLSNVDPPPAINNNLSDIKDIFTAFGIFISFLGFYTVLEESRVRYKTKISDRDTDISLKGESEI